MKELVTLLNANRLRQQPIKYLPPTGITNLNKFYMPDKSIAVLDSEIIQAHQQDKKNEIIILLGAVVGVCPDKQLIDAKIKAKELGLE
jgi:hypothetical protein